MLLAMKYNNLISVWDNKPSMLIAMVIVLMRADHSCPVV